MVPHVAYLRIDCEEPIPKYALDIQISNLEVFLATLGFYKPQFVDNNNNNNNITTSTYLFIRSNNNFVGVIYKSMFYSRTCYLFLIFALKHRLTVPQKGRYLGMRF